MKRYGDEESVKDEKKDEASGGAASPDAGRVTEALLSPFGEKSPREALADHLVIKILADDAGAKKQLAELARSANPEDVELARGVAARVLEAEGK